MSTLVMAACWPLRMPPTMKSVLISLADNANDHGECWPSVARVCERTCFSERAVHRAIAWLEEKRVIRTERVNGRSTRFVVDPAGFQTPADAAEPPQMRHHRISGTPADAAPQPPQMRHPNPRRCGTPPPQMRHPTPADAAPRTVREPSRTVRSNRQGEARSRAPTCPHDVDLQTWSDWLDLRKAKRAPVTETVIRGARAEAKKAGMSLTAFLEIWCQRGSQGLQADWLKPHERASHAGRKPSVSDRISDQTWTGTPEHEFPEALRRD